MLNCPCRINGHHCPITLHYPEWKQMGRKRRVSWVESPCSVSILPFIGSADVLWGTPKWKSLTSSVAVLSNQEIRFPVSLHIQQSLAVLGHSFYAVPFWAISSISIKRIYDFRNMLWWWWLLLFQDSMFCLKYSNYRKECMKKHLSYSTMF